MKTIEIFPQYGNWYAISGKVTGCGKDPIAALADLCARLIGISFEEPRSGVTLLLSSPDFEIDPSYRPFVDAMLVALSQRDGDGLSAQESLLANYEIEQ